MLVTSFFCFILLCLNWHFCRSTATGFSAVVVVDIVVVAVLNEMQIANAKKIYFN